MVDFQDTGKYKLLEKGNPQEEDLFASICTRVRETLAPLEAGGYPILEMVQSEKAVEPALIAWVETLQVWGSYTSSERSIVQKPRARAYETLRTVCQNLETLSNEVSATPIASELYKYLVQLEHSFSIISASIEPESDEEGYKVQNVQSSYKNSTGYLIPVN